MTEDRVTSAEIRPAGRVRGTGELLRYTRDLADHAGRGTRAASPEIVHRLPVLAPRLQAPETSRSSGTVASRA
jgi:hypothetical protein